MPISITDFEPKTIRYGTLITITGTGFSSYAPDQQISIGSNSLKAEEVNSEGTKIRGRIPFAIRFTPKQNDFIVLFTGGAQYRSTQQFTFESDIAITDFEPKMGRYGDEYIIRGTGFSTDLRVNKVGIGGITPSSNVIWEVNSAGTLLRTEVAAADRNSGAVHIILGGSVFQTGPKTVSPPSLGNFTIIQPEITDFHPKEGRIGERVTLTGTGFPSKREYSRLISFGSSPIAFTNPDFRSFSEINEEGTELTLRVPPRATTGRIKMLIGVISGNEITSPASLGDFRVLSAPLTVTDFSPKNARPGEEIMITGTGFSLHALHNRVAFGNDGFTTAASVNAEGTMLTARVPTGARNGKVKVRVGVEGSVVESSGDFMLNTPTLTFSDFVPKEASLGNEITITGTGFSLHVKDNRVSFGNDREFVFANEVNADGTKLKVQVYEKAVTGKVKIRVGSETLMHSEDFRLRVIAASTISDFTPKEGRVGDVITIRGSGFSTNAKDNTVAFGWSDYVSAHEVNTGGTELKVRVPVSAQSGEIWLRRPHSSRVTSPDALGTFTLRSPVVSITNFLPKVGRVGNEITITGTGFSLHAKDNRVSFGNVFYYTTAHEVNSEGTQLKVRVPRGAQDGTVRLQILSLEDIVESPSSLGNFTIRTNDDDVGLINITTLEQLDAIRYDLNGDGVVSFTTADPLPAAADFSNRNDVLVIMGDTSAYAEAFASGDFYATAAATTAATGAVAASTTYYYKLSSAATSPYTGYELMNNLDFEDADGDGTADDKSIWAEGATVAGVSGAVAEGWATIGDNSTSSDESQFTATFDGRGHTISNLYIDRPSTSSVGLFGVLGTGSNVRNLGIEGGSVTGENWVGGLAGSNSSGTISACYATGNASGVGFLGGLVGSNNSGTISACYATGNATGTGSNVGGLVGSSGGTISACYATGDATSGSGFNIGGLVGQNSGTISVCYATGNASGSGSVGGLVGDNFSGTIRACYATGNATSGAFNVGGLVGQNTGTISACYATGNASGNFSVGGLVGNNSATIRACYATGNASGTDSNSSNIGGLVGLNGSTVTNSYFDSSVSNRPASDDYAKTTVELQTPTAYGTAMDIYANWNIDVDNGLDVGVDDGTEAGDATVDNPWDFGTNMQYPVLQVDFDRSGTPSVAEFGMQPRTAPAPAAPVVSSFSPSEGEVGTSVTITGENFSDVPSENDVRFGGVMAAEPTSASTTSLTVRVPSGARTGSISVAVGGQTGTSSENFTVIGTTPAPAAPVVSSFSPSEGAVGTSVTITGENFSATASENEVRFGGMMAAEPTSASTTSLTVLAPSGARTGSISVAVGGQTGTSSEDFTVTAPAAPVVSSFSPTEGEVGTSVIITGDNFSATPSENEVRFGGVMAAEPTSASTTSLTILVPSGARTGSISVAVGGQTGTSSENFTVTGTTPEPAAFSVPLSSEGDVRLYPNPTSGQLHFKGLLAGGRYVCDLYSLVGQKVLSSVVRTGDTMDTSTLSSAQYILILQAEGRELMRTRLLVVR